MEYRNILVVLLYLTLSVSLHADDKDDLIKAKLKMGLNLQAIETIKMTIEGEYKDKSEKNFTEIYTKRGLNEKSIYKNKGSKEAIIYRQNNVDFQEYTRSHFTKKASNSKLMLHGDDFYWISEFRCASTDIEELKKSPPYTVIDSLKIQKTFENDGISYTGMSAEQYSTSKEYGQKSYKKIELAEKYNYMPIVIEVKADHESYNLHNRLEYSDYTEIAKNIFFPKKVVLYSLMKGKREHLKFIIKDISVNKKIEDSDVLVSIPKGAKIHDYIDNVEYKVDENGKPDGLKKQLPQILNPVTPKK